MRARPHPGRDRSRRPDRAPGAPANLVVFDPEERLDRRGAVRLEGAELRLPRARAHRARAPHDAARAFTVADGKVDAVRGPRRRCWPRGRLAPSAGTGVRGRGRDLRRGRVQHRHGGLPGGPHRSVVRRPDRGDDLPAPGQLRHERRRPGVGPRAGGRLRGARGGAPGVVVAVGGAPSRTRWPPRGSSGSRASTRAGSPGACASEGAMRAADLHGRPRRRTRWSPGCELTPGMAGADLARTVTAEEPYEAAALVGRRVHRPGPRLPRGRLRLRHEAQHPAAARGGRDRDHRVPGADAGRRRWRRAASTACSSRTVPATRRSRPTASRRRATCSARCRSSGSASVTSCSASRSVAAPTRCRSGIAA